MSLVSSTIILCTSMQISLDSAYVFFTGILKRSPKFFSAKFYCTYINLVCNLDHWMEKLILLAVQCHTVYFANANYWFDWLVATTLEVPYVVFNRRRPIRDSNLIIPLDLNSKCPISQIDAYNTMHNM